MIANAVAHVNPTSIIRPPLIHRPIRIQRSWLSVLPNFLLAAVLVVCVREFSYFAALPTVDFSLPLAGEEWLFRLPIHLLVGLVLVVRPLFLMGDTRHVLAEHHLYSEQGRMSLGREKIELAFEEMLGVRFRQTLLERVLSVGTIFVWTAMSERPEVVMRGVRHPEKVVHTIRVRIDDAIKDGKPRIRRGN